MSELSERLARALAGRYALARELGRGGMATVFLARDLRHHRDVALKVLHPELAATIGAGRFLREIEIAARLTHPHILPLHDSGEADGLLYYVMPFVEGGSLRHLLAQRRRLEAEPCLAIVSSVADALGYAHRMGVVHRDVKPENILFSQGHPVVADFGIARAVSSAGGTGLTRTGFPVGTPGYMSPEQAAGLDEPDARTDVFALAVVTYEMLVGELPGRWPSDASVEAARFLEAPTAHRERLGVLGRGVEAALVRAMAIQVEARTRAPADLVAELRGGAPRRLYREDEVREIVRRASELEAAQPTVDPGMTIGGVQELAGEVGIPAELVRRAAEEALPAAPAPGRGIGDPVPRGAVAPAPRGGGILAPSRIVKHERDIAGEVSSDEFPVLVDTIREVMGQPGQVSQMGRTLEWSLTERFSPRDRNVRVTVTARDGRTRVVIREDLGPMTQMAYGGLVGGLGAVGSLLIIAMVEALGDPGGALIAVPLWLATMYAAARITVSAAASERRRQLARLAERLDVLVRQLVLPPLPGPGRR